MNTLDITKNILKENKIYARKSMGQNFLTDDEILDNIVEQANIKKDELVIEIGPGLGNLTKYILKKEAKVLAFEIDKNMENILNKRFNSQDNLKIVMKDFLKANINEYIKKGEKTKIIANLPYYITTPIIFKLLENKEQISDIVIMVQKEVADRIIASPKSKDFGILSINVKCKSNVEKLFDVPKDAFIPEPSITSSVIRITPDENKLLKYGILNETTFDEVLKASFLARRKKLINSIELSKISEKYSLKKEDIKEMLESLKINLDSRAEELNIEDFVNISNYIEKIKTK